MSLNYEVKSFHEFEHEDETVKLVKLNNPLGLEDQQQNADWSNTCKKWTPELRAYVGASQFDDDDNS